MRKHVQASSSQLCLLTILGVTHATDKPSENEVLRTQLAAERAQHAVALAAARAQIKALHVKVGARTTCTQAYPCSDARMQLEAALIEIEQPTIANVQQNVVRGLSNEDGVLSDLLVAEDEELEGGRQAWGRA